MSKTLREALADLLEARATLACMAQPQLVALDRAVQRIEAALADQAQAEPDRRLQLAMQNAERWKSHALELSARLQQYEPGAGMALNAAPQPAANHFPEPGNMVSAQPVAVPDGYALVPVEPTLEMLDAAFAFESQGSGIQGGDLEDVYRAMLAAAPKVQP